ncbi:hypothetical protein [Agromyces ramosus]|uniref:hypothetical protein n=1 Tax=Agromyces ramosus TaxID=33879 RepID=UPI0027D90177|nr:hypothetical protein [Agromyces ramosus]
MIRHVVTGVTHVCARFMTGVVHVCARFMTGVVGVPAHVVTAMPAHVVTGVAVVMLVLFVVASHTHRSSSVVAAGCELIPPGGTPYTLCNDANGEDVPECVGRHGFAEREHPSARHPLML